MKDDFFRSCRIGTGALGAGGGAGGDDDNRAAGRVLTRFALVFGSGDDTRFS